jgi:hypothetical protein
MMSDMPSITEFERRTMPITESGCWIWMSTIGRNGYGSLIRNQKNIGYAHRLSWLLYRGPIPDGLNVLHRCDVPICVNPDHLSLGTQAENIRDMLRKDRHPTLKSEEKFRGASFYGGKWNAYITIKGKSKHIGRFATRDEAAAAARKAEQQWENP